eukprot:2425409-Prymnesium_polylepis.1
MPSAPRSRGHAAADPSSPSHAATAQAKPQCTPYGQLRFVRLLNVQVDVPRFSLHGRAAA